MLSYTPFASFNRLRMTALHRWLRRAEFLLAMEYVADMLAAGIDLTESFTYLSVQGTRLGAEIGQRAQHQLEAGRPLADIFLPYVDFVSFSTFVLAEQVGALASALRDYVIRERSRRAWRQNISRTLAYPLMLLAACYALAAFVRLSIQPELQNLQDSLSGSHHTDVISTAAVYVPSMLLLGLMILPCAYGALHLCRRLTGKRIVSLPFDDLLQSLASERFAYGIQVQLAAGVSVMDALGAVIASQRQTRIVKQYAFVRREILRGHRLSEALPIELHPLISQFVEMGEQTGDVSEALSRACTLLRERVAKRLQRIASWLEPCVMSLMGLVVASIMYSVLGPMYQTISSLNGA